MQNDESEDQPKIVSQDADGCFIVAPGYELIERLGLTAENRPIIKLNPENVPDELRTLIPYAETWGIADDLIRADVLQKASPAMLQELITTVSRFEDALAEWLADPEAYHDEQTEEYYTFSALWMALDEARYVI